MASWPTYARILRAGYQEHPDWGVLRTDMDGGIAKQRARYSLPIVTRTATVFVKTTADRRSFDAWLKSDLSGGVNWFDYTDPVDQVIKQARIVGSVQWQPNGVTWQAQIQLETLG